MKYKTITLLLNIYNYNKLKDIEIILLSNKTNKDLIINELNNSFNNLKKDINYLKKEINQLKIEKIDLIPFKPIYYKLKILIMI